MVNTNWTDQSKVSTDWTATSTNSTNWVPGDVSSGDILQEDGYTILTEDSLYTLGKE